MVMKIDEKISDFNSQWDSGIPVVTIATKRNLIDYLNSSFATILFTKDKYLQE